MKLFHLIIYFYFFDTKCDVIAFCKNFICIYSFILIIYICVLIYGHFFDPKEKKPSESDKKQTELATKYQTLKRETHQLVNLILLEENKDISYKIKRKAMHISTKLHTRHNEKLSAELSQKAWIASQEELEV